MAANLKKQSSLVDYMTRMVNYSKKLTSENAFLPELKEKMAHLKDAWRKFQEIQDEIEATCGNDELRNQFVLRDQVENFYYSAFSNITYRMEKLDGPSAENRQGTAQNLASSSKEIHLPEISLIKFSGEYIEWPSFESSFIELIHNATHLSDRKKL